MVSLTPTTKSASLLSSSSCPLTQQVRSTLVALTQGNEYWLTFSAAIFLVVVPVFVQAPLVRFWPLLSLGMTLALVATGYWLSKRGLTLWADLTIGFTWTWLSGALYWGWLRWEPLFHLPVEAIGLPFALWGIWQGRSKVGHFFYLGSLLGTALTDVYFYATHLINHWRWLMQVEDSQVRPIFRDALAHVTTSWGIGWAIGLTGMLLAIGLISLRRRQLHWWAFGGAVLSTVLVDSLFLFAAIAA